MDAIAVLRMLAQWAHQEFEMTTADVEEDVAHQGPQGKAGNVASSMAHVIYAEDSIVQGILRGKPPLGMTAFEGKTGIGDPQMHNTTAWIKSVRLDLPRFRTYAKAVAAATDEYIASLKESDLDRIVDLSQAQLGERPVGWVIGALVIGHLHDLTGEISAAKGAQGRQGYPF